MREGSKKEAPEEVVVVEGREPFNGLVIRSLLRMVAWTAVRLVTGDGGCFDVSKLAKNLHISTQLRFPKHLGFFPTYIGGTAQHVESLARTVPRTFS